MAHLVVKFNTPANSMRCHISDVYRQGSEDDFDVDICLYNDIKISRKFKRKGHNEIAQKVPVQQTTTGKG